MTTPILALLAIFSTVIVTSEAEPDSKSRRHEVLHRWSGSWESDVAIKPAAWTLTGHDASGTTKVQWILNDQFQQVSVNLGEHETREIRRFDRKSNEYHKWTFNSDGATSFWIGSWDQKTSTMTWAYVDFGLGLNGEISDQFTGGDTFESKMLLMDGTGNILMDVLSTHRRTRP